MFQLLLHQYDSMFESLIEGHNGHVGFFEAEVNMGPTLPPQHKGRPPQYSCNRLNEFQHKFDVLVNMGVFARSEDIGISVEYLKLFVFC